MTARVSRSTAEKGQRLYDDGCVRVTGDYALVKGDHGFRHVTSHPEGLMCSCQGWTPWRSCSHCIAAAIAFYEAATLEPGGMGHAASVAGSGGRRAHAHPPAARAHTPTQEAS